MSARKCALLRRARRARAARRQAPSLRIDLERAELGMVLMQLDAEAAAAGRGELQRRRLAGPDRELQVIAMEVQLVARVRLDAQRHLLALPHAEGFRPGDPLAVADYESKRLFGCRGRSHRGHRHSSRTKYEPQPGAYEHDERY